jgi:hypothetical protein
MEPAACTKHRGRCRHPARLKSRWSLQTARWRRSKSRWSLQTARWRRMRPAGGISLEIHWLSSPCRPSQEQGGLNRSTQHFILNGKDGVYGDESSEKSDPRGLLLIHVHPRAVSGACPEALRKQGRRGGSAGRVESARLMRSAALAGVRCWIEVHFNFLLLSPSPQLSAVRN